MPLTPEQRAIRASIAAHERWGRLPSAQRTEATIRSRKAFHDRFLAEVDAENPGLPDAERHKLAAAKESAYMRRLQLASSKARASRAGAA